MPTRHVGARSVFSGLAAALTLLVYAALVVSAPPANAAGVVTVVVDFSEYGQGPFDQSYFQDRGVSFTEGSFVGYVQGDEALIGPVAGSVKKGFRSISVSLAPAFQGTADYTLSAQTRSGRVIASNTLRVTQDDGDAGTGPFGYVTMELGSLPVRASSFRVSNSFVRSSYPNITGIEFGVSLITVSQ